MLPQRTGTESFRLDGLSSLKLIHTLSRLNLQHEMLNKLTGGTLLPPEIAIYPEKTYKIADVATGTGFASFSFIPLHPIISSSETHLIKSLPLPSSRLLSQCLHLPRIWLTQLSTHLPLTSTLTGFDISPSVFPLASTLPSNVSLYVHNTLDPFPMQQHSTYDIVHVRLLAAALKAEEWPVAVKNVVELLRKYTNVPIPVSFLLSCYSAFQYIQNSSTSPNPRSDPM